MLMRNIILFSFLALVSFGMIGCATEPAEESRDASATVASIPFRVDGTLSFLRGDDPIVEINIEIADTDSARTRGLMERRGLPERSGMLFIFDDEAMRSFWMANTPLALDILFADADSQILTVRKYTRPMSPQSVTSTAPARFVVEVPAGFSDSHGIVEGDNVRW